MRLHYEGKYNLNPDSLPHGEHVPGAGDYYNVFNAMMQMPKHAQTYLYGMNSYWYLPKEE